MVFQLGTPLLDACVLAVLKKGDAYGYILTQQLQQALSISESTLYPVLRKMQKELYLETYDQAYQGRNRRYYKITETGEKRLMVFKDEWEKYKQSIDKFLGGEPNDEE